MPNMNWPDNPAGWFDLITIFVLAVFLLAKALLMYVRSRYFDRLGIAMIAANVSLGISYAGIFVGLLIGYDPLPHWMLWAFRCAVLATAGWGLYELLRSTRTRVEGIMSPTRYKP